MKIYGIMFHPQFRGFNKYAMRRIMQFLDLQYIFDIDGDFYLDNGEVLSME